MKIEIESGKAKTVLMIIQRIAPQKVNTQTIWKMLDLLDALDKPRAHFNRTLEILQKEYFIKGKDPENPKNENFYVVDPERQDEYMTEFNELLVQKEIMDIGDIKFEDFKEYSDMSLTDVLTIREFLFKQEKIE